ncbi:hypothetical protein [Bradyrhizobium sp. 150]|uniref:hypothetical protein n=1 Tax=Bradyrhizobium sp. 150 TaxID=2782625 RepID=UPI001FFAA5CC|nr:hypothetical protein [Bradyrhizobium sp. 150]MCK1670392.1 hypothetical protein [Bradyrhizobium sp. 150]
MTASILNSRLNFRLCTTHLRFDKTSNLGVHHRQQLMSLLLPFASACCGADRSMTIKDWSPEVVRSFRSHLEQHRHCSGATRKRRLSTINSLPRFVGIRSPVHLAWCTGECVFAGILNTLGRAALG